ncbi:MAG: hypothetical protein JSW51_09595 [Gemmatimonadota bacterium]|nr:MAG: hypothetical protein JSW51_09595 [Gemmatimonadota bacterium]
MTADIGRPPSDTFSDRVALFSLKSERAKRRLGWLTHLRLAAFVLAGLLLVLGGAREDPRWIVVVVGVLLFFAYAALVVEHRRATALTEYLDELRCLNEEALQRLARNWDLFRTPPVEQAGPEHPYAEDLNLFGPASLFQLLCTAATPVGRNTLRRWLLRPAMPETVVRRQEAVAELSPLVDLRDELTARGNLIGGVSSQVVDRFLRWTQDDRWILNRPWLLVFAWLLPLSTVIAVILQVTGVIPYHVWVFAVLGCAIVWRRFSTTIELTFRSASSGEKALSRFSILFRTVANESFEAPLLADIAKSLAGGREPAHRQMRSLDRILACSDVRFSGLLHGLLQLITLWDLHVLYALERWREENRSRVESWFSAYGELEALMALAGLAHGHPRWEFPIITSNEGALVVARELGHPLLAPEDCVTNDVQLGPPGTFLLVTGSNMAGKSTLLRAIGANVVLAQAGAPVCASSMSLPGVRLFTAMHVHDSLADGVSQFMAALNRLKLVVEAAECAERDDVTFVYLLDEILQGTNAAERQTAVRRIVRHMLETGAIGATSTHDLTLADTDDLEVAARLAHFQETIEQTAEGPVLSFDYKLKPGLATSTNALRLMDIVGL